MSLIKGTYKAVADNPKALKKLEAVKKLLRGQDISFTETETVEKTNWLDKDYIPMKYNWKPRPRIEKTHHLIVLAFEGELNFKPVKQLKQPAPYIPAGPPLFDYRNTPEDLAFFAETEAMEPIR